MGRALRTSAVRRACALLLALALIVTGAVALHKQLRDGNDFPIYWQASRDLLAGRSPYDVTSGLHGYVYLPWFALLLAPLALLPLSVAAALWYVANAAFLWWTCRALIGAIRVALPEASVGLLGLASLALVGLVHDNLVLGQANLLLLLLVALGVRGAMQRGDAWASGVPLGLAAALKMPAAMLLVPLVLRGRWRAAAGALTGALFALALPFLATGSGTGMRLLGEWRAKVVAPAAAGTLQGSKVIDQSPQAALRRLLVAEPAYDGRAVNWAAMTPAAFANVSRAVSAALLAGYLLLWLLAPARGAPLALLLDLALGCCAMVQLTGFSLKAQFVVLLLPMWLAAKLGLERRPRLPLGVLVAAGGLLLLSQPALVGRAASNLLLAYSSMTLGTLLLALALAWFRARLTLPPSASPAAGPVPGTVP